MTEVTSTASGSGCGSVNGGVVPARDDRATARSKAIAGERGSELTQRRETSASVALSSLGGLVRGGGRSDDG
jgi:hypothetical protein